MTLQALETDVPHTGVHRAFRRFLELAQDLVVVGIGAALFGLMGRTLVRLLQELIGATLDFRVVIAEILFMLVMIEVLRLLIVYLEEHRVAVDFMVELSIVAALREIVLRGVTELHWHQILALSLFLLAFGTLLRFGDLRRGPLSRTTVGERVVVPTPPRLEEAEPGGAPRPIRRDSASGMVT